MAEKCARCGGWRYDPLRGTMDVPPINEHLCYCDRAQKEALESAAAKLKEQGNNELDPKWRAALFGAAVIVSTHVPAPKPRPRVSRKAVEEALRHYLYPGGVAMSDTMAALSKILDLED